MSRRPRLLLVTRNLPPLRGGMERLNAHMAQELAREFDVTVLAPSASLDLGESVVLRTSPVPGMAGFLAWAMFTSVFEAWRSRPDWVLGGSGLVAPIAWAAARLSSSGFALYLHGLDIVVDHWLYRVAWLPFVRRADRVIANSRHTASLAAAAGLASRHVVVVNPGTDLPSDPLAGAMLVQAFRERHGLDGARILLSVGRLTARKGLAAFVENVLPGIVRKYPSAMLVVIGDDAQDALAGGNTSQRTQAQAAAGRAGLERHVRFLGPVDEPELLAAYAASDVHVFPVREVPGDVEGFGMVAIEAAAYGLPTVATRVGGVPDAVADGRSGYLVPAADPVAFVAAVNTVLSAGRASFDASAREFASGFAWKHFGTGVRGALERVP